MITVVIKVLYPLIFELIQGVKLFQVKELTLQNTEEIFNHDIVKAVALSAHALLDTMILEQFPIVLVLVLPALIGVQDRSGADRAAHNVARMEIEYRGQIELLSEEGELRDVCHPFPVRRMSAEIPFKEVRRGLSDFTLAGANFLMRTVHFSFSSFINLKTVL